MDPSAFLEEKSIILSKILRQKLTPICCRDKILSNIYKVVKTEYII